MNALKHRALGGAAPLGRARRKSSARHAGVSSRAVVTTRAIHIDRNAHFEAAWKRQEQRDALLATPVAAGVVTEVVDAAHLDAVQRAAGNALVVVCLYSPSCGACKRALQRFTQLCREARAQRARAVFCTHNIVTEFDDYSDIARFHRARAVPAFMFFDDGSLVRTLTLRDVRSMAGSMAGTGGGGGAGAVQRAIHDDLALLAAAFREMVFRAAPGARP